MVQENLNQRPSKPDLKSQDSFKTDKKNFNKEVQFLKLTGQSIRHKC